MIRSACALCKNVCAESMHTQVFSIPHCRITRERERKKTMTRALFKRAKLWDKHTNWSSVSIKRSRIICQRTIYQDWEDLFPFSRCCKARRDYRPQPATRILLPSWDKLRHTHCSENVELRHEFPVESKATRARYSQKMRSFHVSIHTVVELSFNAGREIELIVVDSKHWRYSQISWNFQRFLV